MKLIHKDIRKGIVKLKIDNLEDLWYLSHIIDKNDVVSGKTMRKIKKTADDERTSNVTKKPVYLSIQVEKLDFSDPDALRISGIVTEGPEDVPRASHHTITADLNAEIKLTKQKWLNFQLKKLDEASKEKASKILIVIFDREEAYMALMKPYDYEVLVHLKGNVTKKADIQKVEGNFYKEIIKSMQEYVERYKIQHIILASPSFWKEELLKELKDEDIRKMIIQATCSSVTKSAFNEVLKRDEIKQALHEERIATEMKIVEALLQEISKDSLAVYGLQPTTSASQSGAVKDLLVTTKLISDMRDNDSYDQLDSIMQLVESSQGIIHIINSEHDAGKKLDGLGGIAAILRYRLNV